MPFGWGSEHISSFFRITTIESLLTFLGRLTCIYICCHNQVVTVSTEDILPVNPDILEGVDDLLQLSYLNEPSVLHNLQLRYACDKIYVSVVNEFCYWVLVDK